MEAGEIPDALGDLEEHGRCHVFGHFAQEEPMYAVTEDAVVVAVVKPPQGFSIVAGSLHETISRDLRRLLFDIFVTRPRFHRRRHGL